MPDNIFGRSRKLAGALLIKMTKDMKTKIIVPAMLLSALGALARIINAFSGWDQLEESSPYIIIARCEQSTAPLHVTFTENAPKSDSAINILFVLKGTNDVTSARLQTDHDLRQGENYLVFGYDNSGIYQAYEEYRVIPLGADFSTNSITGKPLDEQLQILFKRRIDNLNREIQNDEAEKQRLEEGIK